MIQATQGLSGLLALFSQFTNLLTVKEFETGYTIMIQRLGGLLGHIFRCMLYSRE